MPLPNATQLSQLADKQKADKAAEAAAAKVLADKAKPKMRATLLKLAGEGIAANPGGGYAFLHSIYEPTKDGIGSAKSRAFAKAWEEVIAAFAKSQKPRGYTVERWSSGGQYQSGLSIITVHITWKKS